jgi:RNA-directed DNA polymerase
VIARLNPIIRGWAAYYRGVVSSKAFHALDYHVWKLAYKWAKHTHPNKSKWWICGRYFGMFKKFRNDRWVFGARDRIDDHGAVPYLVRFSWTDMVSARRSASQSAMSCTVTASPMPVSTRRQST